jgi:hypothetical protein
MRSAIVHAVHFYCASGSLRAKRANITCRVPSGSLVIRYRRSNLVRRRAPAVAYRLNQRSPITVQPKTMLVFLLRLPVSAVIGQAERAAQQIYQCGLEYSGQQSDRDRSPDNDDRQRPLSLSAYASG